MKRIAGILMVCAAALCAQEKNITPGPGLKGWHISQVNHHGNSTAWKVEDGIVSGTQDRADNGGIILTDAKYKDFDLTLELNPDFGCDSGLFLRSNEKGEAYQVMLDYVQGGNMGGIYGEGIKGVKGAPADWQSHWKKDGWNTLRVRMEGAAPHIQVWMNGDRITDWTDTENHAVDGATDGMIALQVHGGKRCEPGKFHRFRNIRIRELR